MGDRIINIDITHKSNRFNFKIAPNNLIILINGDSGTGKTLFFNAVRSEIRKGGGKNLEIITMENVRFLREIIEESKDKIIVIDEANLILEDKDVYMINRDVKNRYIIMGRGGSLRKLEVGLWDIKDIVFNEEKGYLELISPYENLEKEVSL